MPNNHALPPNRPSYKRPNRVRLIPDDARSGCQCDYCTGRAAGPPIEQDPPKLTLSPLEQKAVAFVNKLKAAPRQTGFLLEADIEEALSDLIIEVELLPTAADWPIDNAGEGDYRL